MSGLLASVGLTWNLYKLLVEVKEAEREEKEEQGGREEEEEEGEREEEEKEANLVVLDGMSCRFCFIPVCTVLT